MSLNPKIEKDADGTYWLRWTPDPSAEGYAFTTPAGSSRTFDPTRNQTKLGKSLVEPVVATVAVLDVTSRAAEQASYPPVAPPPVGTLPFAEAQLRSGYRTLTTADIPVGTMYYTLPAGADCLIDLGWVKRDRALKIYTQPGQRVHTKHVHIDVARNLGGGAYQQGGFGYRPKDLANGSDHLSLTGCFITGVHLADGLTFGDQYGQKNGAAKVTYQKCRVESASQVNGGKPAAEAATEHCDAFQTQGPLARIEFGLCTIFRQWAATGHPGKGIMLNAYSGNGNAYEIDLRQVNFRDAGPGSSSGAVWIKDYNTIRMSLADVWSLIEGNPTASWAWQTGSALFLNTAVQNGGNQPWSSSGAAPNREASFPAAANITGKVREGLPSGGDFVTRASLGL